MTNNKKKIEQIRIDFSFKREVFFVVVGAIVGAITFIIPKTIFETQMGLPYYLSWIVFGHIVGVYSSQSIIAGIAIHMLTAISIGIVVGIFLYKTGILNISKLSNGILYGLLAGTAVFVIFYIPVQQLVLTPETARTLVEMESPDMTVNEAAKEISDNFLAIMIGSVITHLVFGVTVGIISSLLSIRFGSRYRCSICDISFSRIDSYQKHIEAVHGAKPIKQKRILILGGGFAGVQVLREIQKEFQDDVSIDITLVSKDNFFLFTPMLPEVSSGMIETRHIATPIRAFCKRARFYEANVKSIDLDKKEVSINHSIGKESSSSTHTLHSHIMKYDYLILALGGETNFFGMTELAKNAFTIKTLDDAIILRNHVINMLEQADIEYSENNPRKSLMTFVVVGGGFSGVETAGELNDFVRDSIKHFYHNIDNNDVKIIVVNSGARLLPEVTEDLSEFTLQKLRANGVEVILNTRVVSADKDSVKLNNGSEIICHTLIWAGGVTPEPLIASLPCKHDKSGRLIANDYLEVQRIEERGKKGEDRGGVKHTGIFALGDCASIIDPNTSKPCPPTAQHAIRQGKVAARNLISVVKQQQQEEEAVKDHDKKISFDYRTKGMMAKIGKRNGVGILLGHRIQGFAAWWLWRSYYLANLPTVEKKLRVIVDWSIDIFFKRDVTRLKTFASEGEGVGGGEERSKTETEKTSKEEIVH